MFGPALRSSWPLAIVFMLALGPFVIFGHSPALSLLLLVPFVLALVGMVRLTLHVGEDARLRSRKRLVASLGGAGLLFFVGRQLGWALYNWNKIDNDWVPIFWSRNAAWWVAYTVIAGLFMTILWAGSALLVQVGARLSRGAVLGTLLVSLGIWLLALGAVVVKTDKTSEDILFYTMPGGTAFVALGIIVFAIDSMWPRPNATSEPSGI